MPTIAPVKWPEGGAVTPEWVHRLASSLDANTRSGEPPKNLSKCVAERARLPPTSSTPRPRPPER